MSKRKLLWKKRTLGSDHDAAAAFLTLIFSRSGSSAFGRALRSAPLVEHAAKDLLRASELPLLPRDELSVKEDTKRLE